MNEIAIRILGAASLIAITLGFYWKSLGLHFVSDDLPTAMNKDYKTDDYLESRADEKNPDDKRVRVRKTKRWDYFKLMFVGRKYFNPKHCHILTLACHTTVVVLIYLVFGLNYVSFLAALLFSINPVNLQGSVWISGRGYVLSTIMVLIGFGLPYIAPVLYIVSMQCLALNSILSLLPFIFTSHWYLALIVPGVLIWKLSFWLNPAKNQKVNRESNVELRSPGFKKLIIMVKTYGYYFRLCLFPQHLGLYHEFLYTFGLTKEDNKRWYRLGVNFWIGIGLILLVLSNLIWNYDGQYGIVWGLLWFSINIGMWCNFITFNQHIAERYVYLANVGMMLALANMLIYFPPSVSVVFLTYYGTRLMDTMPAFTSEYWNVEYNILGFPNLYYPWVSRGVHRFAESNFHGALADLLKAHQLRPTSYKASMNIAHVYLILGNVPKAREFIAISKKNGVDGKEEEMKHWIGKVEALANEVEQGMRQGGGRVKIRMDKISLIL